MVKLKYKLIANEDMSYFEHGLNSFIENNEVHAVQYSMGKHAYTALVEYTPVEPHPVKTRGKDYNPYWWDSNKYNYGH